MLSPEELAILSKPHVQAFIRERMGAIQKRDSLIYLRGPCFVSETIHPAYYRLQFESYQARNNYEKIFVDEKAIRIPRSIDDERPERGLWGMIDWSSYELITTAGGELAIWGRTMPRSVCDTPTLALLRALEAQIGGPDGQK